METVKILITSGDKIVTEDSLVLICSQGALGYYEPQSKRIKIETPVYSVRKKTPVYSVRKKEAS